MNATHRREFLHAACGFAVAGWGRLTAQPNPPPGPPKVAAVFTEFTYRSHAHVILENFLEPYLFNGRVTAPGMKVVSFFGDQFPQRDMARDVAEAYRIPIYKTIAEALCL